MTNPLQALQRKRNATRAIKKFADEHGFVYFGYVNQLEEAYTMIRGLTVSHQHKDHHFSVGNYGGYDVSYVERSDHLKLMAGAKAQLHTWQIVAVDLHTAKELPQIFIGLHTHSNGFYQQLFTKHAHLRLLSLTNLASHSPQFMMNYKVYGRPSDVLAIEQLFPPSLDEVFMRHFHGLAIEIHENVLYVYSERKYPSYQLLEAMIKNATWLAGHIDASSKEL